MTDRELLELAAKAAGVTLDNAPRYDGYITTAQGDKWNPLTDDGDALRLAVKLDMVIDTNRVDAITTVEFGYFEKCSFEEQHHGDDPYAATRRAIVRAAAEIGRNMK